MTDTHTVFGNPIGIYAKVIADSISEHGHRLTTMEVQMHRFVLAEFNTHRAFSRNSASSRAIPVKKIIEQVESNPALPIEWSSEQSGMQGGESLDGVPLMKAHSAWLRSFTSALNAARGASAAGLHKSLVNRLLEPFMWQRVIVTATDWGGFFEQRCSPLAQPEIRVLAEEMRKALEASEPAGYHAEGVWHLPYISDGDMEAEWWRMDRLARETIFVQHAKPSPGAIHDYVQREYVARLRRISAARCARVSYLTHEGKRDIEKDLALYEKLRNAEPPHWSPMEHQATPELGAPGNLTGWRQFRHYEEA